MIIKSRYIPACIVVFSLAFITVVASEAKLKSTPEFTKENLDASVGNIDFFSPGDGLINEVAKGINEAVSTTMKNPRYQQLGAAIAKQNSNIRVLRTQTTRVARRELARVTAKRTAALAKQEKMMAQALRESERGISSGAMRNLSKGLSALGTAQIAYDAANDFNKGFKKEGVIEGGLMGGASVFNNVLGGEIVAAATAQGLLVGGPLGGLVAGGVSLAAIMFGPGADLREFLKNGIAQVNDLGEVIYARGDLALSNRARLSPEAEAFIKDLELAARKKAEAETARKKVEAEAARKKAEAEAARKKVEAEAARKKAEAEAERKKAEAEAERKKAEERQNERRLKRRQNGRRLKKRQKKLTLQPVQVVAFVAEMESAWMMSLRALHAWVAIMLILQIRIHPGAAI